jgi:DNA-nicking Smr family endonuclease
MRCQWPKKACCRDREDRPKVKAKSLKELHHIQQKLAEQQQVAAAQEAARREAERHAHAERNLFVRAAGAVQPTRAHRRVHLAPDQPAPIPVQQQLDDQRVLQEAISDEFDSATLLDVDDALSFRRPGIGTDVTRRLRKGDWSIQGEIDLHGLRREEAREALSTFVREAHRRGWRCVRVVHGKGLGSPGKTPVLKGRVQSWLIQKNEVLAFVQARGDEGGAGALVVLLKPGVAVAVR